VTIPTVSSSARSSDRHSITLFEGEYSYGIEQSPVFGSTLDYLVRDKDGDYSYGVEQRPVFGSTLDHLYRERGNIHTVSSSARSADRHSITLFEDIH
jgi:hypothetical protein